MPILSHPSALGCAVGYAADGGVEFAHGEASVTRALLAEAGLSLSTMGTHRASCRRPVQSIQSE
jgi:hypothetical protein